MNPRASSAIACASGVAFRCVARNREKGSAERKGSGLVSCIAAPQTRVVSRPLRIEFAGALYHVMARGNARQPIFHDDEDRQAFVANLGRACDRFEWRLWAWCLMDTHFHLLVETVQPTSSRGMREVNQIYTQGFNRRHGRVGHGLQGRYKAVPVDRDAYLLEVSRYLVMNPVRSKRVVRAGDWAWSSYRAVVGRVPALSWLAVGQTLALFGREPGRARRAYARFVAEGVGLADPEVRQQLYMDDDQFIDRLGKLVARQRPAAEVPRRQQVVKTLATFVRESRGRDAAIQAAYASGAYTLAEIGTHFDLHYATVSRIARRGDIENKT